MGYFKFTSENIVGNIAYFKNIKPLSRYDNLVLTYYNGDVSFYRINLRCSKRIKLKNIPIEIRNKIESYMRDPLYKLECLREEVRLK